MSTTGNAASSAMCLRIVEGSDHRIVDERHLPYDLKSILGSGGFCVVTRVQDRVTGGVFAHRVFRLKGTTKQRKKTQELFKDKRDVIRRLNHPHITRIFVTYTTATELNMIMTPVADGGVLDTFLGEYIRLLDDHGRRGQTLMTMTRILQQTIGCLADRLSYMHRQKIRHKDIVTR
jgi:serine/threonine protein kinase